MTPTSQPPRRLRTRATATALGRRKAQADHDIDRLANGQAVVARTAGRPGWHEHGQVTSTANLAADKTRHGLWTPGTSGRRTRR